MLVYFHCFSVLVWTGGNNLNMLCVDAWFLKMEKKISVFKNIRIRAHVALINLYTYL